MGDSPKCPDVFPQKNTMWDVHLRELKWGIRFEPEAALYHIRIDRTHTPKPIRELSLTDIAPLLHREVALYDFVFGGSEERMEVFKTLWDAWCPHRDKRLTLEDPLVTKPNKVQSRKLLQGGFAVCFRPVNAEGDFGWDNEVSYPRNENTPEAASASGGFHEHAEFTQRALRKLVEWHEALTDHVASEIEANTKDDEVPQHLQPTFQDVFVVLDDEDWENKGFLVFCWGDKAKDFGLVDADRKDTVQGKRTWGTWKVGVLDLVEKIMAEAVRLRK